MDRKGLAYSGLLLISLVIVSVLFSRGTVQAVLDPSHITLSTTSAPNAVGEPRYFDVELLFPNETATLSGVQFVVTSTSGTPVKLIDEFLALNFTTGVVSTTLTHVPGNFWYSYEFVDVAPATTGPPSTLPGGSVYKGINSTAKIKIRICWTPPANTAFAGTYSARVVAHVVDPATGKGAFPASSDVTFTIDTLPAFSFAVTDITVPESAASTAPITFDAAKDVQLNSDGVFVTWTSAQEEDGKVEWALSSSELSAQIGSFATAADWRTAKPVSENPIPFGQYANKRTHQVRILGVTGGSEIHYRIVSGGVKFPQSPITLPTFTFTSPDNFMNGTVTYADGSPGAECFVSFSVSFAESIDFGSPIGVVTFQRTSVPVNTISSPIGNYTIGITNIRKSNSINAQSDYSTAADSPGATANIVARCDNDRVVTITPLMSGIVSATTGQAPGVDLQVSDPPPVLLKLKVVLEQASTTTTTIETKTASQAVSGADFGTAGVFKPVTTTLVFPPGTTSTTTTIPILDDALDEVNETFKVELINPSRGHACRCQGKMSGISVERLCQ